MVRLQSTLLLREDGSEELSCASLDSSGTPLSGAADRFVMAAAVTASLWSWGTTDGGGRRRGTSGLVLADDAALDSTFSGVFTSSLFARQEERWKPTPSSGEDEENNDEGGAALGRDHDGGSRMGRGAHNFDAAVADADAVGIALVC